MKKLTKKQKEWLNVDKSKCFICQKGEPKFLLIKNKEDFKLCLYCKNIFVKGAAKQNAVTHALTEGRGGLILTQVLGMQPQFIHYHIREL